MAVDVSSLKRRATKLWQQDELPREFAWMEHLSPMHYRLCLIELHAAIAEAHVTGDWEPVVRLVEDWEATALVDANPELAQQLTAGRQEYEDYDLPPAE